MGAAAKGAKSREAEGLTPASWHKALSSGARTPIIRRFSIAPFQGHHEALHAATNS
jgi:hypothetical protein